jgi:hypothetical protein
MGVIRAILDRRFLAGLLCGVVLAGVGFSAAIWWKALPHHLWSSSRPHGFDWGSVSPAGYDVCLARTGSKVRCDALMRVMLRERQDELRAAGFSDQEVDEYLAHATRESVNPK